MKCILIVDDNEIFCGALSETLLSSGYKTISTHTCTEAKNILSMSQIDAVLSDINMPGGSGFDLIQHSKETYPQLPVILMTGFEALIEREKAARLGVCGFLSKPFKKEQLLSIFDQLFSNTDPSKSVSETENEDLNYCRLSIDDFVSGNKIKFDVYVKLREHKYVKIGHAGDEIPTARIEHYKMKNLRFLYLRKEDFKNYVGINLVLLPVVKKHQAFSKEKKRNFLKHTSDILMEQIFMAGLDPESFESAKAIVEATSSTLIDSDEIMALLTSLNSHTDYIYSHCLGVSTYSVMIAKAVGWHSPANIFKIAMGGLLHDIGKKDIPRDTLLKSRTDLTPDEVALIESHPQRGMDILSRIQSVPSDIMQIALQHHENCLGLGYPSRLTKQHIHPMARLVAVADEFCRIVLNGPDALKLSPREAVLRMNSLLSGKFDPQFLYGLMHIFKIERPD